MNARQFVILAITFAFTSASFASAVCPIDMKKQETCLSTPKPGDQDAAANIFSSIAVCTQGSINYLVFEKDNRSDKAAVTVSSDSNQSTYSVQEADVKFSLSIPNQVSDKAVPAKFTVNFTKANIFVSSTYTCTR